MALIMLPCDLPWWDSLQRHLTKLLNTKHTEELIEGMNKIHELCNIGLDPEEDETDPEQFIGLSNFLDNDLTTAERLNFFKKTLPNIVSRALNMKQWKPPAGLLFSLQQQPDKNEIDYKFVSSLLAHSFFSTFPKRTMKTHPTLQDFNFTHFFKSLNMPVQKAKLRSILYYFDWLEDNEDAQNGHLKILRQVMSSKEWLTIEDWLECTLPLCPFQIKHEGRLERASEDSVHICFASSRIGSDVLSEGHTQECIQLSTFPEILSILLSVEALEDNEVLTVEGARHVARIINPKSKSCLEYVECPPQTTVCCMDAENYSVLPISQFEEDNILRELNKCLLAFQQKQYKPKKELCTPTIAMQPTHRQQRRLSPIGESICSTPPELASKVVIRQPSTEHEHESFSTDQSNSRLSAGVKTNEAVLNRTPSTEKRVWLTPENNTLNNRRGRFIVLGSSGECLPVKRTPLEQNKSVYSSCSSGSDEYHSAQASPDNSSEDEAQGRRYSGDLNTPERRHTFAERLRDALRRDVHATTSYESSTDESSYAVGISIAGSGLADKDIVVRRGGSRGFMLQGDSIDEDAMQTMLREEQKIDGRKSSSARNQSYDDQDRDDGESSKYSFSSEYSSELEEVFDQFSRWMDDPILKTCDGLIEPKKKLDARDLAVLRFAGSLLKRALSDSFAGVPLTEGCANSVGSDVEARRKNKIKLSAKSLSLELARHKHKLAAQLIKQLSHKSPSGLKSVSTGNWGCGHLQSGDVQLKVIIQWLAASVAGIPSLIYYTAGHPRLTKLDTLIRILTDRKWTVQDLAQEMLHFAERIINGHLIPELWSAGHLKANKGDDTLSAFADGEEASASQAFVWLRQCK